MNTDQRQSQRFEDFITVASAGRNSDDYSRCDTTYHAITISLSEHFASMLMPPCTYCSWGLGQPTRCTGSHHLHKEGRVPFLTEAPFAFTTQPNWMGPCPHDKVQTCNEGIDFVKTSSHDQIDTTIDTKTSKSTTPFFIEAVENEC